MSRTPLAELYRVTFNVLWSLLQIECSLTVIRVSRLNLFPIVPNWLSSNALTVVLRYQSFCDYNCCVMLISFTPFCCYFIDTIKTGDYKLLHVLVLLRNTQNLHDQSDTLHVNVSKLTTDIRSAIGLNTAGVTRVQTPNIWPAGVHQCVGPCNNCYRITRGGRRREERKVKTPSIS